MKALLFTILLLLNSKFLFGIDPDSLKIKNDDVKIYAKRLTSPIHIDGKLIEPFWQQIEGFEDFIQREPIEGVLPSERTVVKIAYDDNALYIGARMFDSSPDSIIARLSRRDNLENSDFFAVGLDPYHDKRSGYFFIINAAGVLIDGVLFNDTYDDDSWDAVWEGKAAIDGLGWTAEMRIPFSQLKFNKSNLNVWGINYRRSIARKNENDYLVFIPKTENGFVSHFAELHGMNDLAPPNQIELFPYVTARAEYIQTEDGNPFNDGSNYVPGAGLDLKMSIGTGLTLNGTINPDFGQVEIDPAVINLSDVEVFFPERRPFFIEGSSIFDFGRGGAQNYWGFNWGSPDFFYSRRIGRDPQGSVPDADYIDYPTGTHILGAAKLTGKLGTSWNFGTIQSLTKREYARLHTDGIESRAEVEPLTYYGVIRAQKEFSEGSQGLGVLSTLTLRDFNEQRLQDEFNKSSLSVGLDGWTFLGSSRTWVFAGWTGMSTIKGNTQRLIDVQESSQHYFQRPDANQVSVDSSAESLTGIAGRVVLNKEKGNLFVNSAFGFITPSFEVNDLGFLFRTDVINMHIGAGYDWTTPTDFYRELTLGAAVFQNYDFGGNLIGRGLFHFGDFQFLNYYNLYWNIGINPEVMNNTRTRGGPYTLNPGSFSAGVFLGTDSRNDWILRLYGNNWQNGFSNFRSVGFDIEYRPLPN
ncbi:MAG: carbohydrate binding family 9 domain-containing protein, partial [Bacteroidetes bacterium]|nr:carbohydrate binding family 9 domain-containing protein [Bacteroidota bacterium]